MAWSTCPREPNNQNKPGNQNNPKKTPINGTYKPIPYNGFEVGLLVYDQGGELHQTVMSPLGTCQWLSSATVRGRSWMSTS